MIVAAHTPGPWSASAPDGSYHDVIRIFVDADPEGVAPVAICPQRQSAIMSVMSGQKNDTTEAAANGRLIAAAPDLLAALRLLVKQNGAFEQVTAAALNEARDAIAKASGGAA